MYTIHKFHSGTYNVGQVSPLLRRKIAKPILKFCCYCCVQKAVSKKLEANSNNEPSSTDGLNSTWNSVLPLEVDYKTTVLYYIMT